MKVIITGGGGFLGQCLAKEIVRRGSLRSYHTTTTEVTEIVIADMVAPNTLEEDVREGVSYQVRVGDITDPSYCHSLLEGGGSNGLSIFHLGGVMSGTCEQDFDVAMAVNLQGTINMLEATRRWHESNPESPLPTFIFTSSGFSVGSGFAENHDVVVSDYSRAVPNTTYGCTKACGELLLADYSRRGFLDGRGVRLPTVVLRAGQPNAATTSCFSAVVREPLKGENVVLPIGPNVLHAITGYRAAIEGILAIHDALPDKVTRQLGFDRTVFLPSRALSLSQLSDAMHTVVAPESMDLLGKITYDENEFLSNVVSGFPIRIDASRAIELGAPLTPDAETLIREYCEDFPSAVVVKLSPG